MIVFYRTPKCPFCEDVQLTLKTLAAAHRTVVVDADGTGQEVVPRIEEGREVHRTREEITLFLELLGREMTVQREMQSDSCKIDPDTGLECL